MKKKAALTQDKDSAHPSPIPFLSLFPWFILGFLLLALINSFGLIPVQASQLTKTASKFFMVASLAAIGLGTGLGEMRKSGVRPMIHGFIISALVVIVAILVEWCMGLL